MRLHYIKSTVKWAANIQSARLFNPRARKTPIRSEIVFCFCLVGPPPPNASSLSLSSTHNCTVADRSRIVATWHGVPPSGCCSCRARQFDARWVENWETFIRWRETPSRWRAAAVSKAVSYSTILLMLRPERFFGGVAVGCLAVTGEHAGERAGAARQFRWWAGVSRPV
jgi:hypothetical protein